MSKVAVFIQSMSLVIVLFCANISTTSADVIDIKSDAPTQYIVKKGDTLWDISNLFLDKPWLWPELWRNNVQIENPHLIYPGDILRLRYDENGQPVIEIEREKSSIVLTPSKRVVNKPSPISLLPWSLIAPYVESDSMMPISEYRALPTVLGDRAGTPMFSDKDYVLTRKLEENNEGYRVIRKVREVVDSEGKNLGVQVTHLSDAQLSNSLSGDRQIVRLVEVNQEARQGDKLMPKTLTSQDDLVLSPASPQVGELVKNMNGNVLSGKRDFVINNLGSEDVSPGTIFGIYQKGPDIKHEDNPEYANATNTSILDYISFQDKVEQPAFKVGEAIVIKTFDNASYAWVTKAEQHLQGGEILGKP